MRQFVTLLATILLSCHLVCAQQEGISLSLINTNLADALVRIDSASTTKRIQFIYDELEEYKVNNRFYNLSVDDAVRQAVGYFPMRVLFTPEYIFVESAEHVGSSPLDSLMAGISRMVELEEVRIEGKNLVFDKGAYLSVIPRPRDVKASGRGIVLLAAQQLPGLRVDVAQQNITVNGGTPILMVNGKERSKERVVNLNPEKILRIEYSNNPSIRYMDRGATGIINIVLREPEDGGSVMMSANTAFTTGFVNGYMMTSYNKGPHEVALEYNMNMRNYGDNPIVMHEQYLDPRLNGSEDNDLNNPFYYIANALSLEYTYQPTDSTMFIATLTGNHTNGNRDGEGVGIRTLADHEPTSMTRTDYNHMRMLSPVLDLFVSHKLPANQKVEVNVVGEYNSSLNETSTGYLQAGDAQFYHVRTNNHGYSLSGEAVYSKRWQKLESRWGVQYQHNLARNAYLGDVRSEMFKDNTYLYGELQCPIGEKLFCTLGSGLKVLSVKNSQWEGQSERYDESSSYLRNMTTFNLNYKLSSLWTMQYTGQYRPDLPTLSQLSPVTQIGSFFTASMGNQNLKPSNNFTNRLALRFYHEKSRIYVNLTPMFDYTSSPITETVTYSELQGVNRYISHPDNGDYASRLALQVEAGVNNLWDHVNLWVDGTWKEERTVGTTMAQMDDACDYSHKHRNFTSNMSLNAFWGSFVTGCYFTMSPEWTLMGERIFKSEVSQSIFAQYRLNAWTFTLDWICPFNKNGYSYESKSMNPITPWHRKNWTRKNANMIALGIVYKANFGKSFQKGQKTLHNGGYDSGSVQ